MPKIHGNKDYINYTDDELEVLKHNTVSAIRDNEFLKHLIEVEQVYRHGK